MNKISINEMEKFITKYLDVNQKLDVLDVGSLDVNGSYRSLFNNSNWNYFGLDIQEGKNVDIIAKEPYNWNLEKDFDVIISGQCLEHVEDVKEWILQVNKFLKIGGFVCIIAPWSFNEHRYPIDCWRILPDGMRFLLQKVCNFQVLSITKVDKLCIGIAKKV